VYSVRVIELQNAKEGEDLHRVETTIDIITEEEKLAGGEPPVNNLFKHVDHVEILSVEISDSNAGRVYFEAVGLSFEELRSIIENLFHGLTFYCALSKVVSSEHSKIRDFASTI